MVALAYNSSIMKPLPDVDLAKFFRETREMAGYTQSEMAAKLGVALVSYQRYEYGSRLPNGQAVAKVTTIREELLKKATYKV